MISLENTDTLDLESVNNRYGWQAYLGYNKVKVHRGLTNHIVRTALYKAWTSHQQLLEPKTPWWLSPLEAFAVKKLNMESNWANYSQLLKEDQEQLKLKTFEEIRHYLTDWLQYHQLNNVFNSDKKTEFWREESKLRKVLLKNNNILIFKTYDLLLKCDLKDEELKEGMVKWAQDIGHTVYMEQWKRLWRSDISLTACYTVKENIVKMFYRWYRGQ